MDHHVGIPRDQRVAWASYDRASQTAPFSHRGSWSGYSQPIDSHPVSDEYGGVPHRRDRDPANRSQCHQLSFSARQPNNWMRTDPWQRRTHRSFRQMTESSLDTSRVRRGSRETQYDAAHSPDRSVWGEAPDWQSPVISKHRRISQNAHWEPDAVALDAVHGDAHHTNHHASNHPREMLPGVKEPHHEDRHGRSHKDKHHLPIPPKAPKIPRLPTPDFDDVDYGKDNMTNHQFCACCNDDASFEKKSKRRECAVAKMERQVYEAKAYIARKDSRAR